MYFVYISKGKMQRIMEYAKTQRIWHHLLWTFTLFSVATENLIANPNEGWLQFRCRCCHLLTAFMICCSEVDTLNAL